MDALCVNENWSVVQDQRQRGLTRGLHQDVAYMQITMLEAQNLLCHSQRPCHLLQQADSLGCILQLGKHKYRTTTSELRNQHHRIKLNMHS